MGCRASLFCKAGECICCMSLKAGWTWTLSLLSGCFQDCMRAVFKCCLNWTRLEGRGCHLAVTYIVHLHIRYLIKVIVLSNNHVAFDLDISQMLLKGLHTYNCLWQWWLFSQSQGVISDLLSLTYTHTHTTVDIQWWISFCSILKETCNFYESQVRWVPLPGHTLSPDRSLL